MHGSRSTTSRCVLHFLASVILLVGGLLVGGLMVGGVQASAAELQSTPLPDTRKPDIGAPDTVWDLPTAYPASSYHTQNALRFAAAVATATDGALQITVHPGASLFRANEIKRAVQGGQADAGEFLLSAHANENPLFGFDSVPFLATGFADSARLWAAARPVITEALARQGLELLYAVPWPPQGLFSRRPVTRLADLTGLRVRVYSPATARLAALAGARGVTIQAAELAQALATGAVDANITSGATGYDTRIWEIVPNFYDLRAWMPLNVTVVNRRALAALDATARDAVQAAARTAETEGWRVAESQSAFFLTALRDNGMTVTPPAAAFATELQALGATLADEWQQASGTAGADLLARYRATAPTPVLHDARP
ncbi:MAG: TRAP transporter substrate-binding protein [Gammaproteobacteria bacterium]